MLKDQWLRLVCGAQALYYLIIGLWPIIHMTSFLAVTGPQADLWPVRYVGALTAVIGAVLMRSWWLRGMRRGHAVLLGAGSALAYMAVDLASALPGHMSSIHLVDAAIQLLFAAGWIGLRVPALPWSAFAQRSSSHRL
jgi:hypothetical protein